MLTASNPLLLYVHIPYCIHKCHYCDFNSHVRGQYEWSCYEDALLSELAHWAAQPQFSGRKISSIFFGGGTPSLAPASLIASVIKRASNLFEIDAKAEISLEANPGTVDQSHFLDFREAGINRLSIGVQSLDDNELKWLERIHDRDQAMAAFERARASGFDNINLDLMYGLPAQSIDKWMSTLNKALQMKPEHFSCYQLTVEPYTKLAATVDAVIDHLPNETEALEFLTKTRARLADAGYHAYEVSNFSKPGFHCRHNDGYWLYHDYIGVGAGASGKWDNHSEENTLEGGASRYSNIRQPEKYIEAASSDGCAINSDETLTSRKAAAEALWLGLRRTDGIELAWYYERFGESVTTQFGDVIDPWIERGCIETSHHCLRLTDTGLPLADTVATEVLEHS
ncbi:MAG: radical SAM family heme chaperone HemW [Mariprofundaceae bacterium]